MTNPASVPATASPATIVLQARLAADTACLVLDLATRSVRSRVSVDGVLSSALLEQEQRATHGLAWLATYSEAIRELAAYGERLESEGRLGDIEGLLVGIGTGEYLRVRVGIGRPPGRQDPADFVLRPFGSEERKELPLLLEQVADAIESLVVAGLERTQNVYNSIDGKAT